MAFTSKNIYFEKHDRFNWHVNTLIKLNPPISALYLELLCNEARSETIHELLWFMMNHQKVNYLSIN